MPKAYSFTLNKYFVCAGSKRKTRYERQRTTHLESTHLESLKWVIEEVGAEQINGIMGKGSGLTSGVLVGGFVGKTKTRQHVSQSTPPPPLPLLLHSNCA